MGDPGVPPPDVLGTGLTRTAGPDRRARTAARRAGPDPTATAPTTAAPTSSAPTASPAPARVSEQAVLLVRDTVAPAPAPDVVVDTADDGQVAPAPVPVAARVMTATRWLVVLASLLDG